MRPLPALGVVLLVVALLVAGGIGLDLVLHPQPAGAFAGCRTARQLSPTQFAGAPPMCIDTKKNYKGTIKTAKGDFTFVFLTGTAPKTVNNFIVLAVNGYFDGLSFFRVEDWVVQTGDPDNNGRGGPGYTLPAEPSPASDKWDPGSMGMARFPNDGISGSQFFILKTHWPGGPPQSAYNHFATITLGFDVVGQLTAGDRIRSVQVQRA
jgi:peptidyl-prolyl cis-trans isomerase B (cyclophilin B)